jgi:hypothetical protein
MLRIIFGLKRDEVTGGWRKLIHQYFEGDMTRVNIDFNSRFQPIGFPTNRIKGGIA